MKLLIIVPNGIGDLIQIFPLFKLLKKKYRNITIDALIHHKQLVNIIDRYDYIDNTYIMPYIKTYELFTRKNAKKIIKQLPIYDVAFAPFPSRGIYSSLLMTLIKPKIKASHKYRFKKFKNISWFLDKSTTFKRKHLLYNNFEILKEAGLFNNNEKDLLEEKIYWNIPEYNKEIFNNKNKIIGIYPGGNALFKRWNHNKWKNLISRIKKQQNLNIIIFLGPNEKELFDFYDKFEDENCIVLKNKTFKEVLKILSKINLFVGNDGGLTHVFSLYQKPQLTIFGATDHEYAYPINQKNKNILPKNCIPIWIPYHGFIHDKSKNMINNITIEDVANEISIALNDQI